MRSTLSPHPRSPARSPAPRRFGPAAGVVWLALALLAATVAVPKAGASTDLAAILAGTGIPADQVGYLLFDLDSGAVLEAHNPDTRFIPASVAKVPTALAALATLGPDHRFTTELVATGPVVDGRVDGDLYLVGGGDPGLSTDDLAALAGDLARLGIVSVAGGFFYDDRLAPSIPSINPMQPRAASYNPGVSALSANFNRLGLTWRAAADGTDFTVLADADRVDVALPDYPVRGLAAALPDDIAYRWVGEGPAPFGFEWQMSGDAEAEGFVWLPVRDPSRHTADLFRRLAADRGIDLPVPAPGAAPATAAALASHRGARLTELVDGLLRFSNNLSAELVGLAASRAITGAALSPDASALTVGAWFAASMPQVAFDGMILDTHSGLSASARLTPRQTAAFLAFGYHGGAAGMAGGDGFFSLLPERPYSPALAEALAPDQVPGTPPVQVRAKTGTMSFGRGLAGYIDTAGGIRVGFAIYVSDWAARAAMDAAFDPDRLGSPPEARRWLRQARAIEEALVRGWAADW